jgi:hypothetical protein
MIAIIFIPILLAVVGYFYLDLPDKEYSGSEFVKFHDLEKISKHTPAATFNSEKGKYAFGRYRSPVKDFNMHQLTPFQTFAELKEFAYTAVADQEWFIGSAILQFHYNAAAIVYVLNTKTNVSYITQLELPLVAFLGASFDTNSSAINGCVYWNGMLGLTARKCYNSLSESYDVQLTGTFKNGPKYDIQYSISLKGEAMSMVFPLGPKRPSLVTKYAGAVSSARLVLDGQVHLLHNPLGMMDWTRGLLRRLTYWHWTTMSWSDASGNAYGVHLSEGTYDNEKQISLESTLWINHEAHHVAKKMVYRQLNKAVKAFESDWSVVSEEENESVEKTVQLTFRFANVIKGSFHYGIIDGDLFHMWGLYSGTIRHNGQVITLKNVPGTLEDHYALW